MKDKDKRRIIVIICIIITNHRNLRSIANRNKKILLNLKNHDYDIKTLHLKRFKELLVENP
jgi:hypothetical protein